MWFSIISTYVWIYNFKKNEKMSVKPITKKKQNKKIIQLKIIVNFLIKKKEKEE